MIIDQLLPHDIDLDDDTIVVWTIQTAALDVLNLDCSNTPFPENVYARFVAKALLAHFLKVSPQEVQFEKSEFGKPRLASQHATTLDFNLAHTAGMIAVAIAQKGPLGVDIEFVDQTIVTCDLCKLVYSPAEMPHISHLNYLEHIHYFYKVWTAKEAYLKLLGQGVSENALKKSSLKRSSAANRSIIEHEKQIFQIQHLNVGPSHEAAVSYLQETTRVVHRGHY